MTPPLRFYGSAQRCLVAGDQRGRGRCAEGTGAVEAFHHAALNDGARTGGAG